MGAETINLADSAPGSGSGWSFSDSVFTVTGDVTIIGATTANRILVPSGANVSITLRDMDIDMRGAMVINERGTNAFEIASGATVNLILDGTAWRNVLRLIVRFRAAYSGRSRKHIVKVFDNFLKKLSRSITATA